MGKIDYLAFYIGKSHGHSMEPIINSGDKLYIEKRVKKICLGDIVVFTQKRILLGHRVVKISKNIIITKGDSMSQSDLPHRQSQILGKVVRIQGKYGIINFNSFSYRLVNYYYLIISLFVFYSPVSLKKVVARVFQGRRLILKILINKQFPVKTSIST